MKGQVEELSAREEEVLALVREGWSTKEIATELGISVHTAYDHIKRLKAKLGIEGGRSALRKMKYKSPVGHDYEWLNGYWLSRFDFANFVLPRLRNNKDEYVLDEQINLEHIQTHSKGYFTHEGRNLCGARAKGQTIYKHEFRFRAVGLFAVGTWNNSNHHSVGCFQLSIHTDSQSMQGAHLGNTSNNVVRNGGWLWLKLLADGSSPTFEPARLRTFDELTGLFNRRRDTVMPLRVQDLFK